MQHPAVVHHPLPRVGVCVQAFGMGFAEYSRIMLAPTLVAGCTAVVGLYLTFRSKLTTERLVLATGASPAEALRDRAGAVIGGGLLLSCLVSRRDSRSATDSCEPPSHPCPLFSATCPARLKRLELGRWRVLSSPTGAW